MGRSFAECDAYVRDANRWRHAEKYGMPCPWPARGDAWVALCKNGHVEGEDLDDAIDRAISAEQKEEGSGQQG
jgi:hypothetical protein